MRAPTTAVDTALLLPEQLQPLRVPMQSRPPHGTVPHITGEAYERDELSEEERHRHELCTGTDLRLRLRSPQDLAK